MSDSVALLGAVTAPKPASFPWRADTKALVIAFSVFLLISIWGAFLHAVDVERDLTLRTTIKENANLARAFEEHIIRTIRSVDQVALFVKDQYERHGTHLDLERYTSEGRIAAEIYNQVGVIDEHGMLAMSNVKNFKRLDLSDREHFKVHVARDSGEISLASRSSDVPPGSGRSSSRAASTSPTEASAG